LAPDQKKFKGVPIENETDAWGKAGLHVQSRRPANPWPAVLALAFLEGVSISEELTVQQATQVIADLKAHKSSVLAAPRK
jgi:hypothetical protein